MSLLGRIGQDLVHPFGLGNAPQQPVRTPAPQAPVAQRPIIRTPGTGIVQQFTTQLPHLVSGFVNSATLGQSQHIGQLAQNAYKVEGNAINQGIQHLPQPVARPVANIANTLMVKPLLQTGQHSAQLLQNQNPYHGTNRQQIGQIGGDIVNIASALPIGKAAEGAKLLATGKMGGLGARTIQAAKTGAAGGLKYGAGFGGAQGLTSSMAQNQNLNDTLNNAFRSAIIGGASGAALGGVGGGVAPTIGAGARVAGKGIGAVTKGAKVTANKLAQVPEVIAHNQLVKTDPYYRTYSDQGQQLQTAFDRNAANGLSPNHPTQIQLGKQIAQLNTKTADMRQAMLQNAKDTAQRILPGKGVPLNQTGSAPLDSPLMPGNKLIANAAEKLQGKSLPKAPAVATAVPKKIVSSKESITPFTHDPAQATFKGLQPSKEFPNSYHPAKLGDVLDYPALFKAHPELKDYTLKYHDVGDTPGAYEGVHNPKAKTISLDKSLPDAQRLPMLMHEVQHAIQGKEGRLDGTSSSAKLGYHGYKDNPIEVEARKVGDMYKPKTTAVAPAKPKTVLPGAAKPVPQPASKLPGAGRGKGSLPNGNTKQTKFTRSVKSSPEFSAETRKAVDSNYTSDTIDAAMSRAKSSIQKDGLAATTEKTLSELSTERGKAGRDTLAHAIELAKQHDALGTEAGHATATTLLNLAAEHGSALGQGTQILAAIARRSPAGLRNKAINDLKKAGVKVTPEIQKEIQGHINTVASMKDGPARDLAIAVLQKAVSKHLPQSLVSNGVSIWKAGLLSGVKTQQGNAISNGTFGAMKKLSDVPATAVDKSLSLITKQRTKTLTSRGIASGTGAGTKNGAFTMRTGIDKRQVGDKYEQHADINFGNKVIQTVLGKPANMIFRGMNAADQPFWYASLKNSLYDQAKADGLNKGLHGKALLDHMDETVKNPTEKMADTATAEANKSTLNYDTIGSKAIQMAHRGIDNAPGITPAGAKIAHATLDVLAPFVRVPTAFLSRTVDFTPLGTGKEIFHQIAAKKFDQRALSQAIGEGLTGTGAIALGVALTQHKMLSGDYPTNDQKEQQRWKAEGITPNSVKLGNKWVNLNYLGPLGLLFNTGHHLENAKGQGAVTQVGTALGGLGQGLLGQSFLQGLTGFSDALKDPQRNAKSFINSQAASVVPAILNDAANVTDKFQRQANTVGESIKNRIPGLREQNAIKQDVYGNTLQQAGGQLNTLNGLKPSNSLTNRSPSISEVSRLHSVNPNDSNLQVTPTPIGKSITVEGKSVPLNDKQRYDLQKQTGQLLQSKWNDLIKTSAYKAMDDTQKAAALGNIKSQANEIATRTYVTANNLGTYNKPMSAKAVALQQGTNDVATLASSKATGGSSTPLASTISPDSKKLLTQYNALSSADRTKKSYGQSNYDYQIAKAKYENDKASGKLSKAADISAQDNLAKAAVGQNFSRDVRELYGLNKNDIYDFVTSDPNGQKYADQLTAYDKALRAAGINSTEKFKYGFGSKSTGGSYSAGKKASTGKSALASSKVSYSGLKLGKAPKFNFKNTSRKGSSKVALAKYKDPTAVKIRKPKGAILA